MKERERLALFLLSLIWLILTLHLLAFDLFLYWRLWWYDNLIHFLGGFWLAGATLWIIYHSGYANWRPSPIRLFPIVLGSVFLLGAFWEIYEYMLGATYSGESYVLDTVFDFAVDLLGGIAGYYLGLKFVNYSTVNQKNNDQ